MEPQKTMLEFHARLIVQRKSSLLQLSDTLVVDGYFVKKSFISSLQEAGFNLITRLRKDVRIR